MNQQQLTIAWKKYLKSQGMYRGDVESPVADSRLVWAIKKAESKLAGALNNHSVHGLIWQGDKINSEVPPEEYDAGLVLIAKHFDKLKKTAQATLDAIGPPVDQSDQPSATKFVPSKFDTEIQTGDPDESQQIGRFVQKMPKENDEIDELLSELVRMF